MTTVSEVRSRLLEEFFFLVALLGRSPTVVELSSRRSIRDYVTCFGSWDRFLEAVSAVYPDLSLDESLTRVECFAVATGSASMPGPGRFQETLGSVETSLADTIEAFHGIGKPLPPRDEDVEMAGRLGVFARKAMSASRALDELAAVLASRLEASGYLDR